LLSDTPWIPNPAICLLKPGATQGTCLHHESPKRVRAQAQTKQVASEEDVNYVNVTPWFCDDELCPSVINDIIPYKDGSHVTPEYSKYLGLAMMKALNLDGSSVNPPTSENLPKSTTNHPRSSSTTTVP
jgi:hypothetical protein